MLTGKSANDRLKEFRKDLGLNQEEMANSLGLKQGSYSDIERGKVGVSGIITKLIKLYKTNPIWLVEGTGEKIIENDEPYFADIDRVNEDFERPDIDYKKKIYDLLDIIEAPGDEGLKKEVVADLKGIIGRFVLENSKLLQENARLKEDVIRMIHKHQNIKKILFK